MNRDDIIRIAKEAGFARTKMHKALERFAELIAVTEREECAKVCSDIGKEYNNEINKKLGLGYELQEVAFDCEYAIRARGLSEQN